MDSDAKCHVTKKMAPVNLIEFESLERFVSALANKTRLAILATLLNYGEACTCDLTSALNIAQPTVTIHLQKLYDVGLIEKRESWRYTYYSVSKEYAPLIKTILKLKTSLR
ncbi:MAG: metalloregulator ArsR/SmtB family transcription factor [Thermoproteota archaeon]|nr:winged helix-turn-helix transcriptional regulator [Candidatus Brockarchaeota archaeon]MBO3802240.1 winged helix-turn-helix transcriptional regulator [Candidatus Brockarchaeota archaeon]